MIPVVTLEIPFMNINIIYDKKIPKDKQLSINNDVAGNNLPSLCCLLFIIFFFKKGKNILYKKKNV